MSRKKILRGDWRFYSKLGKGRKKKQKYRRATGRHSKIRKRRKGYPVPVSIGYKKIGKVRKKPEIKIIYNIRELENLKKNEKIILAKIGKKKKIEMVKRAKELGIEILNLNVKKFLRKMDEEKQKKEKVKEERKQEDKEKKEEKVKEEKK